MTEESTRWSRRVIQLLKKHRSLIQNIGIPILIFIIDLMIRASLQMDLSDAGADMALLAESAILATLIEDIRRGNPDDDLIEEVFFTLLFIILWLGCLMAIAERIPLAQFKDVVTLTVGLVSLVGAFIFLSEFGERERYRQQSQNPTSN